MIKDLTLREISEGNESAQITAILWLFACLSEKSSAYVYSLLREKIDIEFSE